MKYCNNPHTRLEVKADGSVYCCCEGWLPRPLGNVLADELLAVWEGEVARDVRRSTTDGSFRYCTACPYLPGTGGPVREGEVVLPEVPERVGVLKLDYDQSCNLTCPSCRVRHSREFVDVPAVEKIHARVLASGVLDRTDVVYVTGAGDPFASEVYWKFLRELPPPPAYPGLSVFLHTNGQLLDPRHWEEMGPTKDRVSAVGISVDAATEHTYREVRGASLGRLWDNVDFLCSVQDRYRREGRPGGRPLQLGMFFTVQACNVRELVPFLRQAFCHGAEWVSVTALRNWGTYSPEDFQARAVHLPDHPDHQVFRKVLEHPLVHDGRVVLDRFDPAYTDQHVVVCDGALRRRTEP